MRRRLRKSCDSPPTLSLDELVLLEWTTPLVEQLRKVYDGLIGANAGSLDARLGVTELPTVYDIAPGWIGTSKRDGYEASEIAGDTALTAAKTFGINVVSGTQDEWD